MKSLTLRKPRDFGDVITDTFAYVRIHYKTLGKGLLLFSLPLIIISGILVGSGFSGIMASTANPENFGEIPGVAIQLFIGILLLMLTFLFIVVIVFKHIQLVDDGEENIEFGMLLEGFARNFFGLLGILFLTALIVGFGTLFFILPGIFLAIKLSLAPAAYIIEECDFEESLSRSWQLTKDYWWFTFGAQFVILIIINFI